MSLHDKTVVTPFAWLGKRYCVLTQFLSASQQTSTRAYCIPALANLRGTTCMRSYRRYSIGSCTCPMSLMKYNTRYMLFKIKSSLVVLPNTS